MHHIYDCLMPCHLIPRNKEFKYYSQMADGDGEFVVMEVGEEEEDLGNYISCHVLFTERPQHISSF